MSTPEQPPSALGRTCHLPGHFVACDLAELTPLLEELRRNAPVPAPLRFPRGTLLPDGRLDLCKQQIGPEGARAVAAAVKHNAHVTSLMLGADGIGNAGALAVADAVQASPALETVYLGCNHIDAEGTRPLAEAVRDHPRIKGLWLKRNPIGAAGARAIADMLRHNRTLRTLDLVTTDLGSEGVRLIAAALTDGNTSVERLYLGGNRIGPEDAGCLADMLRANRTLHSLFLSVNRLGDAGTRRLAEALTHNRTLRTLSLSSNGIGPDGAAALSEVLRDHPLQTLELGYEPSTQVLGASGNCVGDAGAEALAEMLPHDQALTWLDLLRNGITDAGFRRLIAALEANRTVTTLITGKRISHRLKGELQRLLARNREACPVRPEDGVPPDVAAIRSIYRTAEKQA
jgi:Ran GTPase-activating protein (RanGAP) involved in mRNA processing and transport